MPSQLSNNDEADLSTFLKTAGDSLMQAQESLNSLPKSELIISQAELEVKVAIDSSEEGLKIKIMSAKDVYSSSLIPEALSTLRLSFTATARETSLDKPKRQEQAVIDDIRLREDVVRLGKILGGLTFETDYIAKKRSWLVSAYDSQGRLVRQSVVADE